MVAPLVTAIREPQLGGSQALLADIATGLSERGHEVAVFAASGSEVPGARVVETGIDPEILKPTIFRADSQGNAPHQAVGAFRHVYELIAGERFDIVHNHAFDEPAIELGVIDAPVVHTLHLPPRRTIARALERARASRQQVICVCVSRWSAQTWGQITQVDMVLPNGVPVDRIPWSSEAGGRLLYAGRFSPEKGAVEAIQIALAAGMRIIVVGSAYDERYASERVEPYRRDDDVEVCDAVSRPELWELMGKSVAVLCPVLWDEPFGLVAAEAQAAGAPVLAFNRGALSEVIVDGVTGALVEDVASAVEALPVVGSLDREACRRHAERNLSLTQTLDAHEALYERLIPASTRSM